MPSTSPTTTTTALTISSPSSLYLRPASPAEKLLCWTRSHSTWAGPLSVPEYLVRETINGSQDITRDGRITYWVLSTLESTPSAGEEVDDEIVAACETLKRPVFLRTGQGAFEERNSYGIASVFTNTRYRGQGAATVLMQRLAHWLDHEGDAPFSALYSDIGKEFYAERGGWYPYSSKQLVLNISSQTPPTVDEPLPQCRPLDRQKVQDLCDLDVALLKETFQTPLLGRQTTRVAFVPTYAQACWHFGTEEHVGKIVRDKVPTVKGAGVFRSSGGQGEENKVRDPLCWLYWLHDFKENHLVILRVVINPHHQHPNPNPDQPQNGPSLTKGLTSLLHAAITEACAWKFSQVICWNPSQDMIQAADDLVVTAAQQQQQQQQQSKNPLSSEVSSREMDSIPCLRWRYRVRQPGDIVWEANEKFAWC